MTTRLLIARHGNTFAASDVVKRVGITDLPLVESGLMQGKMLGAYLKQYNLIPDIIFTSKLKRAIQTAEQAQNAMQTHIPMQAISIFNEIDYGCDENQPEINVVARLGTETLKAWETSAKVPDGWNVDPHQIIKNWQNFAAKLTQDYPEKNILVITSNGIARFAPYLTGDFSAFATRYGIKVSTGALCIFEKTATMNQWNCLAWNVKPTEQRPSGSGQ
jgi:2,3-bisphosphoglycerate-dependent phosphoglycerate mutase